VTGRQKSYRVAEAVGLSNPDLDPIVVHFDDQPGRPAQVFDFREFADFPLLFRGFAGAFYLHSDALRRITRTALFRGSRDFLSFAAMAVISCEYIARLWSVG
jgi:hypothetical protein